MVSGILQGLPKALRSILGRGSPSNRKLPLLREQGLDHESHPIRSEWWSRLRAREVAPLLPRVASFPSTPPQMPLAALRFLSTPACPPCQFGKRPRPQREFQPPVT